ncbi:hypothetical protein DFJ74DRAFT_645548 [Hyaloraphidium curvatum]|nr:hypothetical protein DFJ74DRAFT_645548 [Hyaloraphidium curvatum]
MPSTISVASLAALLPGFILLAAAGRAAAAVGRPSFLTPEQFAGLQRAYAHKDTGRAGGDRLANVPLPAGLRRLPPLSPKTLPWLVVRKIPRSTATTSRTTRTKSLVGATRKARGLQRRGTESVPGYVPPACLPADPKANPGLLDCWLAAHPKIKKALAFPFPTGTGIATKARYYGRSPSVDGWTAARAAQLRARFAAAWVDLSPSSGGTPRRINMTVGGNLADPNVGVLATTLWDLPNQAFEWYTQHAAHSLAVEIKGLVPWTLRGMPEYQMRMVLDATQFVGYGRQEQGAGPKGFWVGEKEYPSVTPTWPRVAWAFLRTVGSVDAAKARWSNPKHAMSGAIAAVIDWGRYHMAHIAGGMEWQNARYYWGPRTASAGQYITGTYNTDPQMSWMKDSLLSWTYGCIGTTSFLMQILRELNVPVVSHYDEHGTCLHTLPFFPYTGQYLSHGDDPYSAEFTGFQDIVPPAELLLIDQVYYDKLLGTGNFTLTCKNVGRRPDDIEIVEGWLSAGTFGRYCFDVGNGRGLGASDAVLADGAVANSWMFRAGGKYQPSYSIAYLKSYYLWEMLEWMRNEYGCAAAPNCWSSPCDDGTMRCALCMYS